MKPSQVASRLRQIAAYIENTHRPSQVKVASDIKQIVSSMHTAEETNDEGITYDRWRRLADAESNKETHSAWKRGVDPKQWKEDYSR